MTNLNVSQTARTRWPSWRLRAAAELERRRRTKPDGGWPTAYVNADTGRVYAPHNADEEVFVYDDVPRFVLLKGGWGGGKSTAGMLKSFHRLRRGMSGLMVSPELEHFKTSLWPAFRGWCPWGQVVESQRRRRELEWEPHRAFTMVFENGTSLYCGGIKDATRWWGGNVHFAHFDEAARYPDASALKTLVGRARLAGPQGEPPQVFITSTPETNWLEDYFGPVREDDPFADFKAEAFVGTVTTDENRANLDPEYVRSLRETLTEAEAEKFLDAAWVRTSNIQKFVNLIWWDNCREDLPPLGRSEPLVLAADAATGGATETPDTFAVVGVTRHPNPSRREDVAVRYCGIWLPPPGGLLDFDPIESEIKRLCATFSVIELAYDKTQLHSVMMRLRRQSINAKEFSQGNDRLVADKQLQDLIMGRRIAHDGNPLLRKHVDNANVKKSGQEGVRIVKRSPSLKVDACVALSMGSARILYYNVG